MRKLAPRKAHLVRFPSFSAQHGASSGATSLPRRAPLPGFPRPARTSMGKVVPPIYRTELHFLRCKRPIQNSLAEFMRLEGSRAPPAFFGQKRRWGRSACRSSCPAHENRGQNRNKLSKIIKKSDKNALRSKKFWIFYAPWVDVRCDGYPRRWPLGGVAAFSKHRSWVRHADPAFRHSSKRSASSATNP